MAPLSDPNVLPELINQTWTLYQNTNDPGQKGQLAGQLQGLHLQLSALADKVPDSAKQEYKNAVSAVLNATAAVKQAQADEAKVAATIGQIAQVIAALAKVAATAAAA
jgi:hypothetical protein